MIKSEKKKKKNQEQYQKTIIEFKGRAAKFQKFSVTFWAKAISQRKNNPESAPAA